VVAHTGPGRRGLATESTLDIIEREELMAKGKCALCSAEGDLELSHLIPRFIAKRLKADSPSPFLRSGADPNTRVQDAPKEYLLCRDCEERFSTVERRFAEVVFAPTMNGQRIDDLVVTREHQQFAASMVWRHLIYILRQRDTNEELDYTPDDWSAIEIAENALRAYPTWHGRSSGSVWISLV
jgi:hypothetical protein